MSFWIAMLLALALGATLHLLVERPRSRAGVVVLCAYAVPLGLLACAIAIRVPAAFGHVELSAWTWAWPALALVSVAPFAVRAWRRPDDVAVLPHAAPAAAGWARWLVAGLWLLIVLRLAWFYEEAWLRPLFGWDAWLAWSAKAKAWVLSARATPYVDALQWWQAAPGEARTSLAHHYPELPSWLQVWLASAAGGWHERYLNLAWPTLWLALVAGCYGQWRQLGASVLLASAGAYVLASLPLAGVHAAMPGYVDLWVATLIVFSALALARWRQEANPRQLVLAVVLALLLPALKLEGMVWAIGLLALAAWFGLERYPRRIRGIAVLGCVALLLLVSWLFELAWLSLLMELVTAGRHGIDTGAVLASTAQGLFTQGNWQLLWYLVPVVVAWRWRTLRSAPALSGLAVLLAAGMALLVLLFLGTTAGRWAESFTAVNRLVLHLAPLAVSLLVLLLRGSAVDAGAPASGLAVSGEGTARTAR
jgi:hypothetical protein